MSTNEAKACLDDVALNLQRSSDAKLAIVGNAGSEKAGSKVAASRAVNTKEYLVKDKGIDASRISLYTGSQDGKSASSTLIPTGATFDQSGLTPVDESAVVAPARAASQEEVSPFLSGGSNRGLTGYLPSQPFPFPER